MPETRSHIAAIILAAGRSTRMGRNKLVEPLKGEALVRHVARAALASRAEPVVIVTGHERECVEVALAGLDVTPVHNADFASGMASSLQVGLAALPTSLAGAVILLGDMPLVSAAVIGALIESFNRHKAAAAVVPVLGGKWGNPVLIGRVLFPEVARLDGDRGARKLLEANRDRVVEVAIDDEAIVTDIDTPAALARLNKDEP